MKLSAFLSIVAVVALVFGIGFAAVPVMTLAPYGIEASRETAFMTRFFGEELIAVGLILWLGRNSADLICQRALVLGGLISSIIGFDMMDLPCGMRASDLRASDLRAPACGTRTLSNEIRRRSFDLLSERYVSGRAMAGAARRHTDGMNFSAGNHWPM